MVHRLKRLEDQLEEYAKEILILKRKDGARPSRINHDNRGSNHGTVNSAASENGHAVLRSDNVTKVQEQVASDVNETARPKPNNLDNRAAVGRVLERGDTLQSKSSKLQQAASDVNGTVVTAYFEIPCKHSTGEYIRWMQHMLAIDDPVVVFTTSDWVDRIRSFRSHATNQTTIIQVRLDDLPIATKYNTSVRRIF